MQKWLPIPAGAGAEKVHSVPEHLTVTERERETDTEKEEEEEGRKWGRKSSETEEDPGTRWKNRPLDKFGTIEVLKRITT